MESPIQRVSHPIFTKKDVHLDVKRDDLIDGGISGNKFRKLLYNLKKIKADQKKGIITFGGPFSNHINAVARAGYIYNLDTVGIIRGELDPSNPTLIRCKENGMRLIGVARSEYRRKEKSQIFESIRSSYSDYEVIPEGGSNVLALQGVGEIITEIPQDSLYHYICVAAGTGGTAAGLHKQLRDNTQLLAFSSLKGHFLKEDILRMSGSTDKTLTLIDKYHFGGYARTSSSLIDTINQFFRTTGILTDPIYNGKLIYGLMDMVKNDYFTPGSKILWIHTGGLQGIEGYHYLHGKTKDRIITDAIDFQ